MPRWEAGGTKIKSFVNFYKNRTLDASLGHGVTKPKFSKHQQSTSGHHLLKAVQSKGQKQVLNSTKGWFILIKNVAEELSKKQQHEVCLDALE